MFVLLSVVIRLPHLSHADMGSAESRDEMYERDYGYVEVDQ